MKSKFLNIFIFIFLVFSLVGCAGEMGLQDPQGEQWLSSYEIFLKHYPEYEGTEKDWITDVAMGNTCNLFGHEWDEGIITTEPIIGSEGEKTYTCANCGGHKYEVLPKIEVGNGEIYEIDGVKYVNYGSYPQTHVGDAALVTELNKLTTKNSRGYYEYNGKEYAKIKTKPDQYGSTIYTYSDGSTVNRNVVEWFKVEPIKWRIISENTDGSYQLYSEYILDAISYYDDYYVRKINEKDIYPYNYEYSNIRAWLNGYNGTDYKITDYTNKGFYNLAFKDNEKGAIITTEEDTFDKIYLLSYFDIKNSNYGFTNDEWRDKSRYAKLTDFAKAVGASWNTSPEHLDNGIYWLSSPYLRNNICAYCVFYDGRVGDQGVEDAFVGVRVACNIKLE